MAAVIGGARPLTSFGLEFADMVPARLLEQRAAADPDHGLVVIGDEVVTLGEIDTATSRLAAALHEAGVGPGDRIGVMLPNGTPFLHVYFAAGKLGAVAVTINPSYQGYLLEYVLRDTDCALLFAGPDQVPAVDAALAATGMTPTLVVVGAVAGPGALDYAEMLEAAPRACSDSVSFTDINCVIYTSGTTGASKGVPITNAHAVAKAIEVVRVCDVVADDVIYSPLPLFHSMALLRGVLVALVTGARCVLRERFSVSNYWDEVRRTGATVGHCVFTIPQLLQKAAPTDRDRDHTLRCLYNARYDAEFERRFGVRLIEGYGLTEAGVAMYMRADDAPRQGSCGRASEDWEVQLLDADDVPVPTGEVGEIALRPLYPWLVTPGYLNKPDVTAATFRNLWFHTGDLARVDEEGYYYFADRKKDSIRRRGENVSSWELEQVLREHPAVEDAAAVPYPSPVGEDDVRVFVSTHPGATVSGVEIVAHCARRLPPFMVPRYVEVLTALPRTPTGRVQKYELRSSALGPDHYDRETS